MLIRDKISHAGRLGTDSMREDHFVTANKERTDYANNQPPKNGKPLQKQF